MTGAMDVTRQQNWQKARAWIVQDIAARGLGDGDRLPPEQDIAEACGVGRHSVRRATAVLAGEGVLSIEQGRGTFVRAQPRLIYRIGPRTRWRENIRAAGMVPGSESLDIRQEPATVELAARMGLAEGAPLHMILRRGSADGVPVSLTRTWHCAIRFPDLGDRRARGDSVSDIYRDHGIEDYRRKETQLHARLPDRAEARWLGQTADQPVLVMTKSDIAADGTVLAWGESLWSAGRVRFALETGDDR